MKEIKLVPDAPFHNRVDVAVMDFPDGRDGRERQRCKVTVEFAESDVRLLAKNGFDFEQAIAHYKDWLYRVVKVHISQDWTCVGGWDEVFSLVEERVKSYYDRI